MRGGKRNKRGQGGAVVDAAPPACNAGESGAVAENKLTEEEEAGIHFDLDNRTC